MFKMDFKEAINYMQKTGKHVVIVTNHSRLDRTEYRIGLSNRFGIPSPACLQRSVCLSDGRLEWKDVDLNDLCRLVACLSYEFEPLVEYVSFVNAVKQIKENNTLKFIRKNDVDNGIDAYLFFVDDAYEIEIQDIGKYYCKYGVILCPSIEDILATDWYVMRGST